MDVGGRRKGFDLALVDRHQLLKLVGNLDRQAVIEFVEGQLPAVVAIDSPRRCAPEGHTARGCERRLAMTICAIRWTPDSERVHASGYYGWIVEGLALFDALAVRHINVIEVFPTASWTRWHGERGDRTRAAWSVDALAKLGLEGIPRRTNQDQRDAIAAAVTARQYASGMTEAVGEIVVPARRR